MASRLPSITSLVPRDLRRFLDRIKDYFEGNDRVVVQSDLIKSGAFSKNGTGDLNFLGVNGEECISPPAPLDFIATGSMTSIILEWEGTDFRCYAYTEIWRASVDDLGQAVLIGTTEAEVYADAVGSNASYYYWIRFVNTQDDEGPYNSTSGTLGETAPDVAYLLEQLTGELTESQLYQDLNNRIDLIDGPDDVAGTIPYQFAQEAQIRLEADEAEAKARADGLLAEASARNTSITSERTARQNADAALASDITTLTGVVGQNTVAIQSEATARTTADTAEAAARETLAAQIRGNYEGSDLDLVTSGFIAEEKALRLAADESLAQSIEILTVGAAQGIDSIHTWYFDENLEGWIGVYTTIAQTFGYLSQESIDTTTPTAARIQITGLNFSGATYNHMRIRGRRKAGSSWNFRIYFQTSGTWKLAYDAPEQSIDQAEYFIIDADMSNSALWTGSTITGIRIYTSATRDDLWEFDYITVGRLGASASTASLANEKTARIAADSALSTEIQQLSAVVGGNTSDINTISIAYAAADEALASDIATLYASTGQNTAAIQTEQSARVTADQALTANVTTLQATVGDNTTAIQVSANAIDGLEGQYTVKVDNNGYVTGYGLGSTVVNGVPTSEFAIVADKFSIAPVQTSALGDDSAPFFHRTTPTTINGVTVPAGTYMKAAFIHDAAITKAKIGTAAVDSAKIVDGAIVNAKIANAAITSAKIGTAQITTALIKDAAITNAKIANASINSAKIQDASINLADINTASINNLSALTANMGLITAGRIKSSDGLMDLDFDNNNIKLVSSASGGRLEFNGDVIKVYDTAGNLRVKIGNLSA